MISLNNFPDHSDLDCCSNAILLRDIYGSHEQFPRPSLNVLDYSHIIIILLRDISDPCESFPRPSGECPGLLFI